MALAAWALCGATCGLGRSDAVLLKLFTALFSQPVGCPWRAKLAFERKLLDTVAAQSGFDIKVNDARRRAA